MSINTAKQNRGETTQRTLWFFGTAHSQKTPRTRIASNFKLYTLNFKLPIFFFLIISSFFFFSSPTHALRTISVAPTVSSINSGLVGYWTFDGKNLTNATATNSAGTSYDGALTNMTATSSKVIGKIGQALTFNGSNQYVNVGNNPLVGATKFTYSSWIKVSTSDFTGLFRTLVDDATGDANTNNGIIIGVDDRGGASPTAGITAQFRTPTGCTLVYSSNIFSSTSQWYHITLAYNGVSTPTLYVNGVSKSYTTGICASGSGVFIPRAANMWLGAVNNGTFYFKGTMDDVRIYNRAISAKEVQTLYQMGGNKIVTPPSGPVGYWKFDSNTISGANAVDSSSNSTTGAIQGSPSVVSGKVGQALSLNGSTDYVAMGTPSSLQLSNGTISAWVKTSTCSGTCGIIWKRYAYGLYLSNGLVVAYDGGGGAASTVNIADGRWHHVLCVFQSGVASGSGIYVDGVRVLTFTHTIFANNVGLNVGADGGRFYFTGLIDDPRVYDRVLSDAEIKTLSKNSTNSVSYGATVSSTVPVSSGLVGYWTFDGKNLTNATATDTIGSNNCTLKNSPPIAIGAIGQGLKFTSSGEYLNCGDVLDVGLSSISVSMWFKSTDLSGTQGLVGKAAAAGAVGRYAIVVDSGLIYGMVDMAGGGINATTASAPYADGKFHLATLIVNRNGSMVLYIDGVNKASVSISAYSAVNMQTAFPLLIGRYNDASGGDTNSTFNFKGTMDDVRIYNRALSATEVQTLYKMGAR